MKTLKHIFQLNLSAKEAVWSKRILAIVMLPIFMFYMTSMNFLLMGMMRASAEDVITEVAPPEEPAEEPAAPAEEPAPAPEPEPTPAPAPAPEEPVVEPAPVVEVVEPVVEPVVPASIVETPPIEGVITPEAASTEAVVVDPIAEVVPVETVTVAEEVPVVIPEWQVSEDGKIETIGPVELGKTYVAPQNSEVTVTFTTLPEIPGTLSIEEITLTPEQVKTLGALSNKAYDITSDMADGTFAYDLTLPKPANQENVEIKFAETVAGLKNADTVASNDVTTETASVSVSLDHFTVFYVATVAVNPFTITATDGTLNGVNGDYYATGHSFWVSLDTFDTTNLTPRAGLYWTDGIGNVAANTAFSAALSSVKQSSDSTSIVITPNTKYYFAAWSLVGGTWYPGAILSFTTANKYTQTDFAAFDGVAIATNSYTLSSHITATYNNGNGTLSEPVNLTLTGYAPIVTSWFYPAGAYNWATIGIKLPTGFTGTRVYSTGVMRYDVDPSGIYAMGAGSTDLATTGAAAGYLDFSFAANSTNTKKDGLVKLQVIWNVGDAPEYFTIDISDLSLTDTTPPTVPVLTSPINGVVTNNNTLLMQWDNSTDTGGSGIAGYEYQVYYNCSNPSNIPGSCSGPYKPSLLVNSEYQAGATNDGTYYWQVRAKDNAENFSDWSAIWNVTLDTAPAPVITDQASTTSTADSITITWTTDHPATSRVVYDTVSHADGELGACASPDTISHECYGYPNSTNENSTLTTNHSVVVSPLSSGIYHFRAVSHGSPESVSDEIEAGTTVTVTIVKYVDGELATADNTSSTSFPITATWNAANIGAGSGDFALDADGFNGDLTPYQAITSQMTNGADYSVVENIPTTCTDNAYKLAGYSTGDTPSSAEGAATVATAALTGITSNKFIVVRNETCVAPIAPTLLGWNVESEAGGLESDPISLVCEPSGVSINDSRNSLNQRWTLIDGPNVKYIRRVSSNGGATWNVLSGMVFTTLSMNGWVSFGSGEEGTYDTEVMAFNDVNDNDLADDGPFSQSGWSNDCPITYDNTLPTDPTSVTSASHAVGVASTDTTIDVTWSGASDSLSGVDGFYTEWNTSPDTMVGPKVKEYEENVTSETSPVFPSGQTYYFHIATVDNAGNWTSTVHLGPFIIDVTAPAVPTLLFPGNGVPVNGTSPIANDWEDVVDADHYIYQSYNVDGSGDCNLSSIRSTGTYTASQTNSRTFADGLKFCWRVKSVDSLGNESDWSELWKTIADNTAPTANIVFLGTGSGVTSFQVEFSEDVNEAEAENPANYFLTNWPGFGGSGDLAGDATVTYDAGTKIATVQFTNPGWSVSPEQEWGVQNIHDLAGNLQVENPYTGTSTPMVDPVTTDSGTDINWHNADVTVTLACDDGLGSGCKKTYYTTDGSTPTTASSEGNTIVVNTEGITTIKYFSVDNAGNTETVKTAANTVKIDKTKPASIITTFGLTNGGTVETPTWDGALSGTATDGFSGSGIDQVNLEITYTPFGGSSEPTEYVIADGTTSWNYQLPGTISEGTYQVTSHAVDNAGNEETTYSITIIYDKTIPEVTLTIDPLNPEGDNNWYLTNPTITLTANDNGSVDHIEYQLNGTGGAWITYASPVTLDDGVWQFYYRSIDTASNASGIGLKNVKVDTQDPDNVNSFQAEYRPNTTDVRLTWNVNDNDIKDVYIYRGGSRTFTVNSGSRIVINDNNDESYNDNNINPGQTYFYKAVARDDAGNNSSASVIRIAIPSGGTAPAVSTALGTEVVPEGTILGTETSTEGQPTVTGEPQGSDSFNQGTETTNPKPEVLGEDVQKSNQPLWSKWWFWLILLGVFSLPVWLLFRNRPTE